MLSLTRKTDYALVALSYLGTRRRDGDGPISARGIADRFELPAPLLMNILKELGAAGLLTATRGSTGGYELAVDPASVTLMDVVATIEGPVRIATCCTPSHDDADPGTACELEDHCPIREPIQRLHERLNRFLAQVTLADLLEDAEPAAVAGRCCCGSQGEDDLQSRIDDTASLAAMPVMNETGGTTTSTCCKGQH